jgi:hypothetical protein
MFAADEQHVDVDGSPVLDLGQRPIEHVVEAILILHGLFMALSHVNRWRPIHDN